MSAPQHVDAEQTARALRDDPRMFEGFRNLAAAYLAIREFLGGAGAEMKFALRHADESGLVSVVQQFVNDVHAMRAAPTPKEPRRSGRAVLQADPRRARGARQARGAVSSSPWGFLLDGLKWSDREGALNRAELRERLRWLLCRIFGGHRWYSGSWYWNACEPQRTSECTEEGFGWFTVMARTCARCDASESHIALCDEAWAAELDRIYGKDPR